MTDQGDRRHRGTQNGPWQTELVEGDPLPVAGRELVPLVRVTRFVQRRASLSGNGIAGEGYGLVHMRPVAILDRGENGQRVQERRQIRNETARVIGLLTLTALLVPPLAVLLIHLLRRQDDGRQR